MRDETKETIISVKNRGEEYDESAAALFMNKEIVAPVIQMVVPEFQGMSVEDIIRHIETDIVRTDPVDDIPIIMEGLPTEMKSVYEKCIRYDTHFKMRNPVLSKEDIAILLHFDLEVQNKYLTTNPAYPLIKRAIYYCARELSGQLGRLTKATDYGKLEKVYSIWICNHSIPVEEQNTLSLYSIQKKDLIGKSLDDKAHHDLISVIMIRRGNKSQGDDIFNYLQAVFKSDIITMQKYSDVEWSEELKKEANTMSGLGMSIYEEGIEIGRREGFEEGIERERINHIENMLRRNKTAEEIAEFCGYSLEEVKKIEAQMLSIC